MFFEAVIECTSCFADVEFGAFSSTNSTTNHIYDVISLAVEVFRNIMQHFGLWTLKKVQLKNKHYLIRQYNIQFFF